MELQTGCPHKLKVYFIMTEGTYEIEAALHKRYASYQTSACNEWFELDPRLVSQDLLAEGHIVEPGCYTVKHGAIPDDRRGGLI